MFLRKPFKYSYFHASLILVLINFIVFFLTRMNPRLTYVLALNPRRIINDALFTEGGKAYHCVWQFVTYMFAHGGFSHIFFNMLALVMFGTAVEKAIGSKEFLLFYFVCGILSGALSFVTYLIFGNYGVFLLGASGAVYAVMFAYAVCYPRSKIYIWGLVPVPAPILVLIYAVIAIVDEVFYVSNISNITHLFGFLTAWLYLLIRMGVHPIRVWKNCR